MRLRPLIRTLAMAGGLSSGTSGGTPPVTAVSVDPPVYGSMVAKTVYAFGENRLVEGYSGNTITLKRLSDNATQAFGFDAQGRHDKAAALAWAAGADVDVVNRICQKGSGFLQVAVGTVAYSRGGVFCFGTDKNLTTSALTRNSSGSVGARMAGGGHFVVSATTLSKTAGDLEFHFMFSQDARKKGSGNTGDPGNNTLEYMFAYGKGSDRRVYMQLGSGTGALTSRFQTSSANTTNSTNTPGTGGNYVIPANALSVITVRLGATSWEAYAEGRRFINSAYTANQLTDLAGTPLDGGTIVMGSNFGSTANDSQLTSNRPIGIDGGLIATTGLTDYERTMLHYRWKQVARHDLADTLQNVMGLWSDILVTKDVNVNGLLVGRKGKVSFQYDIARSGNTWDLNYTIPQVGLRGIRSPTSGSTGNFNNRWAATSNYFADVISGSIGCMSYLEHTGNTLQYSIAREDQSFITATNGLSTRGNLALGFDHQGAGVVTRFSIAKDTEFLFVNGRHRVDGSQPSGFLPWGTAIYEGMGGGINQPNGKYNVNTVHVTFTFGETLTDTGWTWDATSWANTNPGQPYLLDAPVLPNTPENITATSKHSVPLLHLATFKAPVGYSKTDSYAVNKPKRLQGEVRSFITSGGVPLGHRDGSVAINYNAGVADGGPNDYLQSCFFQGGFFGTELIFLLSETPVSDADFAKTDVNIYKILEAAA